MSIKPIYLGCTASDEEILKYGNSEQVRQLAIDTLDYEAELVKQIELEHEAQELREEQLYFAQELIEEIRLSLHEYTTAKDLKYFISTAIENSNFEA